MIEMEWFQDLFKEWSKSEVIALIGVAAPLLMFLGGVVDRILVWLYEWWKSVKCFGRIDEVRAYNKTRNARGQEVTLQVFNTKTKQTKNHLTDSYTEDTESVKIALLLRYFNTKRKNIGLQDVQLVLIRRKLLFFKEELGRFRLDDVSTARTEGRFHSIDEIAALTLVSREWNENNCVTEKIPIEAFLESEQIWVYATDENRRLWKRKLRDTPVIQKA